MIDMVGNISCIIFDLGLGQQTAILQVARTLRDNCGRHGEEGDGVFVFGCIDMLYTLW